MPFVTQAKHALGKLKHRLLNMPNAWRQRNSFFLVYTLGKVGSSTIYATLKKRLPGVPLHHVHFLSSEYLDVRLPKLNDYFKKHIALGRRVLAELDKHKGKRIKIITMVREPVARDVSALFQTWRGRFGDVPFDAKSNADLIADLKGRNFHHTLSWFTEEFQAWTGVDIHSLPFDKERGYSVYRTDLYDILVLKLEKLNDCSGPAMREFIGLDLSRLELANIGEEKLSRDKYRSLAAEIRFTPAELDAVYGSKYMQHFFSAEEIAGYRAKWLLAGD
ncbi:MAG: putative capsular polysaccharide synthesis family protein [Flavobacteriales bacterium]